MTGFSMSHWVKAIRHLVKGHVHFLIQFFLKQDLNLCLKIRNYGVLGLFCAHCLG